MDAGLLGAGEATRLLQAYGIPVAREATAGTPEATAAAAGSIGFPVVLKALSRDIAHKSDVGAVRLGLAAPDEVVAAAREMAAALARSAPRAHLEGFVIQETVRGEAEDRVGLSDA